jgi:exopolysaccharide biosynthesis polyprenyl glycosylphosphotransferase
VGRVPREVGDSFGRAVNGGSRAEQERVLTNGRKPASLDCGQGGAWAVPIGIAMPDGTLKPGGRPAVEELERPGSGTAEDGTPARGGAPGPSIALRKLALDSMVLAAVALAVAVSGPAVGLPSVGPVWLIAFSVTAIALLGYFGVYRLRLAPRLLDDSRSIVSATAVAAMGTAFVTVLITDQTDVAEQAVGTWLIAAACLTAGRGGVHIAQTRLRDRGAAGEPTLVVGAGQVGHLVARRLQDRPEFGLRPVAFLDPDPLEVEDGSDLPVLVSGSAPYERRLAAALESGVRELGVRHVIVTFSLSPHESELELMRRCHALGVSVWLVPRLFEGVPDQTSLERLGGLPLVSVQPSDPRGWQFAAKYTLDRVFALLAILVASPAMLFAAVGTLLTMGRPVLLRQRRVGMDDREFEMRKFRTMKSEGAQSRAEPPEVMLQRDVAPGGVEGEDRRTRFGSFLRRTSIDELPQLFNVLRGEMSLIGPRPERPQFAREFNLAVYRYADRHRVKSGITGWAQVHGLRGKTSLSDRVEWDNYYIENWSLWLDFKILLMTLVVIFSHEAE